MPGGLFVSGPPENGIGAGTLQINNVTGDYYSYYRANGVATYGISSTATIVRHISRSFDLSGLPTTIHDTGVFRVQQEGGFSLSCAADRGLLVGIGDLGASRGAGTINASTGYFVNGSPVILERQVHDILTELKTAVDAAADFASLKSALSSKLDELAGTLYDGEFEEYEE